jgi:hypothetical protein
MGGKIARLREELAPRLLSFNLCYETRLFGFDRPIPKIKNRFDWGACYNPM